MHPLYLHSLNSVYQNLPSFNLHPPIVILAMTVAGGGGRHSFLLWDEKLPVPCLPLSGVSGVGEGEEGLAYGDIENILSAPCTQRACRIITAKVLTAWSWDQQEHLETC